jgi:hypothetical protein
VRLCELGGLARNWQIVHLIASQCWRAAEAYLHLAFATERVRGEWFRLSGEDLALLSSVRRADIEEDWPSEIRDRHARGWAAREEREAARRPVSLSGEWDRVLRRVASERHMSRGWLVIWLLKREAEAIGLKDLPLAPWEKNRL